MSIGSKLKVLHQYKVKMPLGTIYGYVNSFLTSRVPRNVNVSLLRLWHKTSAQLLTLIENGRPQPAVPWDPVPVSGDVYHGRHMWRHVHPETPLWVCMPEYNKHHNDVPQSGTVSVALHAPGHLPGH